MSEPLSGHLKIWIFSNDLYYGENLYICGADLSLSTGSPIQDEIAESITTDSLLCSDANGDGLEWTWSDDSLLCAYWDDLYIELEVPACSYDSSVCIVESIGHIEVN